MEQLGLVLDPPRARRRDPSTSQVAAGRARELATEHMTKIYGALERPGTIYEIAERTGLTHVQVARRLPEMNNPAWNVEPTSDTRASPSGRQCRIWKRRI